MPVTSPPAVDPLSSLATRILYDLGKCCQHARIIGPLQMPQGSSTPITDDFVLLEMHIKNDSDASVVVSCRDRQGTPCSVIPANTLLPGGSISFDSYAGYYCPGGFTWFASSPGVTGYAIGAICRAPR